MARVRLQPAWHKLLVLVVVTTPLVGVLAAIWLLWERAVTWRDLVLLLALYVPTSLGVTVGFHRMLAHRAFTAATPVRAVLLVLGSAAIEGAPLDWAANHRRHHALSDREGDPHSPLHGLLHAHVGWLFSGVQADTDEYCRDVLSDRVVCFVDNANWLWSLLGLLLPFLLGGWSGLLWGGLVRTFLVHHVSWSVNSICHTFGERRFQTADRSRNHWLVGLLALGEGWHNNRHAFPRAAIHGLEAGQLDVSGYIIGALERLGLVHDVYRPSPEALARRRLP